MSIAEALRAHPVADLFPMMSETELSALSDDIRAHGQRHPIMLHRDGSILDGRNRYHACLKAGIKPCFETWERDDSQLVEYVTSENIRRRHLTDEQRAFIAARLANMRAGDNAKLQAREGTRGFIATVPPNGGTVAAGKPLVSAREAAKAMDVNKRAVEKARAVQKHAPELEAAVNAGEISLTRASDEAQIRAKAGSVKVQAADTPRPEPATPARPVLGPPRDGMQFARMAIMQLKQIRDDDEERTKAFAFVKEWISAREA